MSTPIAEFMRERLQIIADKYGTTVEELMEPMPRRRPNAAQIEYVRYCCEEEVYEQIPQEVFNEFPVLLKVIDDLALAQEMLEHIVDFIESRAHMYD